MSLDVWCLWHERLLNSRPGLCLGSFSLSQSDLKDEIGLGKIAHSAPGSVSLSAQTAQIPPARVPDEAKCSDDSRRIRRDGRGKAKQLLTIIVKERNPKPEGLTRRFLRTRVFKILISVFVVFTLVSTGCVTYYYNRYARIIDLKLSRQIFEHTAKIYAASPKLVTNLSDALRAKRRLVEFQDLPKMLVDAVTAGEDQSFFSHHGLDLIRIAGAFVSNFDETHRLQGGSTITQQLARNFFLTAEPTWRRKLSEAFIAVILELRLRGTHFSTIPITSLSPPVDFPKVTPGTGSPGSNAVLLPQFAAEGQWSSETVILNNAAVPLTVRIDLFKQDGTPLVTTLNHQSRSSFQNLVIAPGGIIMFSPRNANGDSDF